jgi:ubiquitin C-terminal hydrolase
LLTKVQKFTTDISGALANSDVDEYLGKQQMAKSANGYVGLKNFGCTCYMNSLIQ